MILGLTMLLVVAMLWRDAPEVESPAPMDLGGVWVITYKVTSTNLERYLNDEHEFEVYVTQVGDVLRGEGEQTRYNGKAARHHYSIWIMEGTVSVAKVMIRYRMEGGRNTTGLFELERDGGDDDKLLGTFASSAAETKGTTTVRIIRNVKD